MSDNLPLEIQVEIMKRLPVKSLIQFQSVSRGWKSLISSSRFIAQYSALHTEPKHLLVVDDNDHKEEATYVSIVDDDTFPQLIVSLTHPPLVNMSEDPVVMGSSRGLLCVYGCYEDLSDGFHKGMAVIWNISIRKAVAVVVPNVADVWNPKYKTLLDFGVCPETEDPKIIKINQLMKSADIESDTCIPCQVEVFTLSTGTWRGPLRNLPRKSILFSRGQDIDGVFYWLATDRSSMVGEFKYTYNLIISFDMASEEFGEIKLPNNLLFHGSWDRLEVASLGKSLVVLEHKIDMNGFVVWMMEGGAPNSFSKIFIISAPDVTILDVLGFRTSGEAVIETLEELPIGHSLSLCVYEPNSKHISDVGINARGSFSMYSYTETLLLLDQPEFAVFDKGKRCIAKWRAKTKGF